MYVNTNFFAPNFPFFIYKNIYFLDSVLTLFHQRKPHVCVRHMVKIILNMHVESCGCKIV